MPHIEWIRRTRRRVIGVILAAAFLSSGVTWTAVMVYQPDPFGARAEQAEAISRAAGREELAIFACGLVEGTEARVRLLRGIPGQEAELERARVSTQALRGQIRARLNYDCGPPGRVLDHQPEETP